VIIFFIDASLKVPLSR